MERYLTSPVANVGKPADPILRDERPSREERIVRPEQGPSMELSIIVLEYRQKTISVNAAARHHHRSTMGPAAHSRDPIAMPPSQWRRVLGIDTIAVSEFARQIEYEAFLLPTVDPGLTVTLHEIHLSRPLDDRATVYRENQEGSMSVQVGELSGRSLRRDFPSPWEADNLFTLFGDYECPPLSPTRPLSPAPSSPAISEPATPPDWFPLGDGIILDRRMVEMLPRPLRRFQQGIIRRPTRDTAFFSPRIVRQNTY